MDRSSTLDDSTLIGAAPDRRANAIAFAVVLISLATLAVLTPFARTRLPAVPAFIPAYESALVLNDLITAVLLFGMFGRARTLALLILACAYLFDALIIVPHALTFPGVFSPNGLLGAGTQTTAWLYCFWHGGFALYVVAYAAVARRGEAQPTFPDNSYALWIGVAATVTLVIALAVLAVFDAQFLPAIIVGADYSRLVSQGVSPAICAFCLISLLLLWPLCKASMLDLWLFVVMCAWLCDVLLSAVVGSSRYDLGWYGGRSFGLLAASSLVVLLLTELNKVHQRLARRTARLQSEERRLRTIFETSHLYQGLMTAEGVLVYANTTSLKGIKAPMDAVTGKPFWETPWFTDTPGMPELVRNAVATVASGESVRTEMQLRLPIGVRWFDFAMRPIFNERGVVTAMVPEAADVTDQRHAEEALRQSQKMEAVGQLTGGIAHDFNNLLTGIMGSLELLQARIRQGRVGEGERYIESAQGAASRAAALTHRLLAFSRRQALDPKATNINRLISSMEELVRRTVGPTIEIEVLPAVDLWTTMVDRNQLENTLLNLCINARDAMATGGRLVIETANRTIDSGEALENQMSEGAYVALCVRDSGSGMTPDVIAHAFDPFFTTKPLGEGTGLGLSMIYGFARQSGGQIKISSEIGKGTQIRLYLPRYLGPEDPAETAAASRSQPQTGRGGTVLVVDDEPDVRMLVAEILEEQGYAILQAGTGAAGLELLRSEARVDLLVTDFGLPGGVNGRQLAEAARMGRPHLKVLFITGYAENALNGYLDPGMQVLAKPFAMDLLVKRIGEIIAAP
jgi:signal transduction histidine kinase/CheY-like chemotaxis protein